MGQSMRIFAKRRWQLSVTLGVDAHLATLGEAGLPRRAKRPGLRLIAAEPAASAAQNGISNPGGASSKPLN